MIPSPQQLEAKRRCAIFTSWQVHRRPFPPIPAVSGELVHARLHEARSARNPSFAAKGAARTIRRLVFGKPVAGSPTHRRARLYVIAPPMDLLALRMMGSKAMAFMVKSRRAKIVVCRDEPHLLGCLRLGTAVPHGMWSPQCSCRS